MCLIMRVHVLDHVCGVLHVLDHVCAAAMRSNDDGAKAQSGIASLDKGGAAKGRVWVRQP